MPMAVLGRCRPKTFRSLTFSNQRMFAGKVVLTQFIPSTSPIWPTPSPRDVFRRSRNVSKCAMVEPGEAVEVDETVAVIETDKVSV